MKEGIGDYFIQIILCMWPIHIKRRTYKVVDSWSHYSRLFPFYFISIFSSSSSPLLFEMPPPLSLIFCTHIHIQHIFQFSIWMGLSFKRSRFESCLGFKHFPPFFFNSLLLHHHHHHQRPGFCGWPESYVLLFLHIYIYSTYTSFPGLLPSLFLPIPGRESRAENRHCCVAVKLIKCWPNARLRRPQYDEPND